MKQRTLIIALIVCVVAWIVGLGIALSGCASAPVVVHGSTAVSVDEPTLLLTGPATGHWAEESEHPVVAYVVPGTDCRALANAGVPEIEISGRFVLRENESLCVLPLRSKQRVLFHANRP